jgi:hypothetical protein
MTEMNEEKKVEGEGIYLIEDVSAQCEGVKEGDVCLAS